MRSGSTWLQMMLGQLNDVTTDFEMKWRPSYEPERLHVPIRDKDFPFDDFFSRLGDHPIKGSKLTFDFFPLNDLPLLTECLPSDLRIIHLTRDYCDVLNSFLKGIVHHYDGSSAATAAKSPISHAALKCSNERYQEKAASSEIVAPRQVALDEAQRYFDIFFSVDSWVSSLSRCRRYIRIDYSQLNSRFRELVRFIGSNASESDICKVLLAPPTRKLRQENVIENIRAVRHLAHVYGLRKRWVFGVDRLRRWVRI